MSPAESSSAESWSAALARDGYVEIRLSKRRVAWTFAVVALVLGGSVWMIFGPMGVTAAVLGIPAFLAMFVLGFLPHLEAVTASGPPVRVDGTGLRLRRWTPLTIPWESMNSVYVHQAGKRQRNLVIEVSPDFFLRYRDALPVPMRQIQALNSTFIGPAFAVPSTLDADAVLLAEWLDGEVARRLPPPREILIAPGRDWPVWDAQRGRPVDETALPLSHALRAELAGFAQRFEPFLERMGADGKAPDEDTRREMLEECRRLAAKTQEELGSGVTVHALEDAPHPA